jgi:RNA polymerase sigma factor (TIGR02999 family)
MSDVTRLLHRVRDGDRAAVDELMPLVYNELRRIAQAFMRRQRPGHTLQPTALVNEAYVKLFGGGAPDLHDRAHFLALSSRVMRQVLVDHARAVAAAKRGGDAVRVLWDENAEPHVGGANQPIDLLDLHAALEALERDDPSLGQTVEGFYFAGMTAEELAAAGGRSVHVVRHELRAARAWLRRELDRC